jgi:hypothetical protein
VSPEKPPQAATSAPASIDAVTIFSQGPHILRRIAEEPRAEPTCGRAAQRSTGALPGARARSGPAPTCPRRLRKASLRCVRQATAASAFGFRSLLSRCGSGSDRCPTPPCGHPPDPVGVRCDPRPRQDAHAPR